MDVYDEHAVYLLIRSMKKTLLYLFVILLLSIVVVGQDGAKLLQRDLWRTRADALTNVLLKEADHKDTLDKVLLMAELSDLWWESDQNQANAWIEKAVDAIAFYSADEIRDQKEKFFRVGRQTLGLISSHNKKQSSRLAAILSKAGDTPDKEKNPDAEGLIEQALKIVKDDPKTAAELGLRALSLGFPSSADSLSWALRRYNPELANRFVRAALANVAASPDRTSFYWMEFIVFPENLISDFPANLRAPVELKISFLNLVADYLSQLQLSFSSRSIASCADEALFTVKLEKGFAELLPQRSNAVTQAINICLGNRSQQLREQVTNTSANTDVDELLKKADESQDTLFRANYLIKAASAAHQRKKFAKSIEILDRMSDEERKPNVEYWEELRWESGARLAVVRFKDGDVAGAQQVLKDIPATLRPLGQITFVLQFSSEDITSYQICVDLLNDARAISKSDLAFMRRSSYWLSLVKLYSNYKMPTEAAETFKEIAVAFNNSRSEDAPAKNEAASNQLITDSKRIIPNFSPILLETKEESLLESVSLVKEEKPRTQMNLEFLKMALRQYQALKVELERLDKKLSL